MTRCRRCGAQIEATSAFCAICGEGAAFAAYPAVRPEMALHADSRLSSGIDLGFVSSLFDFSFSSFVTSKLIKLLYVIATTAAGLFALLLVIAGFERSAGLGVLALILAPIAFLLAVAYSRVGLEILIVVFRIEEHLAGLRRAP